MSFHSGKIFKQLVSNSSKMSKNKVHTGNGKIIGIYDFSHLSMELTDILIWQAYLSYRMHNYKVGNLICCFLLDEDELIYRLKINDVKQFKKNFLYFFSSFFCLPDIQSIKIFRSRLLLNQFISNFAVKGSFVEPDIRKKQNILTLEALAKLFCEKEIIPQLSPPVEIKKRVEKVFKDHFADKLVFCISLEENISLDQQKAWEKFFHFFEQYPIFFLIMSTSESLPIKRFKFSNVHMIEKYNFTLCETLAAINIADGFIGELGGLSLMALFGQKPYIILKVPDNIQFIRLRNLISLKEKHQFLLHDSITKNSLISYMDKILAYYETKIG